MLRFRQPQCSRTWAGSRIGRFAAGGPCSRLSPGGRSHETSGAKYRAVSSGRRDGDRWGAAVEEVTAVSDGESKGSEETFNWTKAWYPVSTLIDADPRRPSPVELLGRSLVLWRDAEQQWRCFEDACPHRLAPLSEGRIERSDGSLMCSYHGWRFDGQGVCMEVPQAEDREAERSSYSSPKSRVKSFPVKVAHDLIWVWPDDGPASFIDSAMAVPKVNPHFASNPDNFIMIGDLYMREIAYPYDFLVENLVDPAHVPYSHHGLLANREQAGPVSMQKIETGLDDFVVEAELRKKNAKHPRKMLVEFASPSCLSTTFLDRATGEPAIILMFHPVPVNADKSLIFFRAGMSTRILPVFARALMKVLKPMWADHLRQNCVIDGDMVFLNAQARRVRKLTKEGGKWKEACHLATTSDLGTLLFRAWFHGPRGANGPKGPYGEQLLHGEMARAPRRQVLDRLSSHTQHCKACSAALRNVSVALRAIQCVAFVLAAWIAVSLRDLVRGAVVADAGLLRLAGGFAVCLVSSMLVGKVRDHFIFRDYKHWQR